MDEFYDEFSVDDILNEIKQQKSGSGSGPSKADRLIEEILKEQSVRQEPSALEQVQEQPQKPIEKVIPKAEPIPTPKPQIVEKAEPIQQVEQPSEVVPPMMKRHERRFFADLPEEQLLEKSESEEIEAHTYHTDDQVQAVNDGSSYIQLRENRKKKIKDFVLLGEEEEVTENEEQVDEETDEDKVIEEFDSMEDAPSVLEDLKELKTSITIRTVLLAIMSVVNLYVLAGNTFSFLPLPSILRISENPMVYALASLLLLIIAVIVSHTTVFGGLVNFCKMKADGDSLPSLAVLTALIQCVVCLLFPESLNVAGVHLYAAVALLCLLFNCIGKLLIVKRTILNFKYVTADCDKYVTSIIDDEHLASDLTKGVLTNLPVTVVNRKSGFLTGFLDMSFREDIYDTICRWLTPIVFAASLILAIGSFVMTQNIYMTLTVFTGVFVVCSSLFGLFAVNLPLLNAVKAVHKHGGMIVGYPAVEEFVDINTATAQGSDLFPAGSVILHGIKTFKGGRIDDAILDAASILVKANSILSDIFMQVIQGRPELLKPVDTIVYEDAMGISGWVDNKRVLIGSRELMLNHGIDVPSKDYEKRYCGEDNSIVYLSNSGELTAVFILSLHAEESVAAALEQLEKNDVFLIVKTVDAVLTKEKLAEVFQVEPALFRVIPSRLHKPYNEVHCDSDRQEGLLANNGNFYSYIKTLLTAKRLKTKVMFGIVVLLASVIIGFLMVTAFCLMGNISQINPLFLVVYHLIWFAVAWLFQKMRRL